MIRKNSSRHNFKGGHYIELLRSGAEYFDACERIIDQARHFIHFQTYIVDDDETGRRFVDALIRAAGRGVRVYFLLDAYGGGTFSGELTAKVENAGILFRKFSPAFITSGFQMSLRLHHKILLADGGVTVLGGMNVANRYRGSAGKQEWLDYAILIRGPECSHALFIVKKLWNKTFIPLKGRSRETVHSPVIYKEDVKVRIMQNNWYRNKIEILKSYHFAMKHARDRMIMMASYFLPGRIERKLLRNASSRGVEIKIVLAANSDEPVFKKATNFLYGFILRNNIKIYEYLPSNMHAKVAIVDGQWTTIGSYNMNHLSDYGSIEMNAEILDRTFAGNFEKQLLDIIEKDCRHVTFEDYVRRETIFNRLTEWMSYQMIRFLMRIMFILTSKKK